MLANSLTTAIRLLMLIPFLGAMAYGLVMTKFGQEMTEGKPGFATNLVSKVGLSWLNGQIEDTKAAVIDTTTLSDDRRVDITRSFPAGSLGLDPATMPEDEIEVRLYGLAKRLADEECETMIQGFARACRPDTLTVQIGEEGALRVRYALSFSPVADAGDLSNAEGRVLRTTTIGLLDDYSVKVTPNAVVSFKAELYAKAQAQCAPLRVSMGNCVVQSVSLTEEPTEDGMVKMTADARLAALGAVGQAGKDPLDLGFDAGATEPEAGMMDFLKRQFTGDGSTEDPSGGETVTDLLDAPSVDGADGSRFKDSKSRAKFVTAP
jgi:hypothetical protein